jgi:centrosomal protein CEP104
MNALRSAGERLGRYALAKRQAVQQEDFSTARLRKEQIEIYKKTIYEQLQIDDLLEKDGVIGSNDLCSELYASKPTLPSPPSLQDVADILARDILPMRMSVDNISLSASISNGEAHS